MSSASVVPYLDLDPYDHAAARSQARRFDRHLAAIGPDASLTERLATMESVALARDHAQLWAKATKLRLEAVALLEAATLEVPCDLLERAGEGLSGMNQHRKARPYLERALSVREAASDRAATGRVAFRLGIAYGCGAPRKLDQAAALYERAIELLGESQAMAHPSLLRPLGLLADLLRIQGRPDLARACAERGLDIARQAFGFGAGTPIPLLPNGSVRGVGEVTLFLHTIVRGMPHEPARTDLERRVSAMPRTPEQTAASWAAPLLPGSAG
jgi:tetratricopeptide (TPR) repeat protein